MHVFAAGSLRARGADARLAVVVLAAKHFRVGLVDLVDSVLLNGESVVDAEGRGRQVDRSGVERWLVLECRRVGSSVGQRHSELRLLLDAENVDRDAHDHTPDVRQALALILLSGSGSGSGGCVCCDSVGAGK